MIGIAAGTAMEGVQTYVTTYAPFVTFRWADQVRHLMGNMNLDIKAIGSSAGLTSGLSGTALLAINDIAFMRSIPNMTVVSPADCTEAVKMMQAISKIKGPAYMRYAERQQLLKFTQRIIHLRLEKLYVCRKEKKSL